MGCVKLSFATYVRCAASNRPMATRISQSSCALGALRACSASCSAGLTCPTQPHAEQPARGQEGMEEAEGLQRLGKEGAHGGL